jgi:hypothetical protein
MMQALEALFFENRIEKQKGKPFSLEEENGYYTEHGKPSVRAAKKVKILRAYGGCLGAKSRRRTWSTAKSFGEPQAGFDPEISEWGNPAGVISRHRMVKR